MSTAVSDLSALSGRAATRFRERFEGEPRLALSPGRVNLIGGHTDYNDGFVLPMAVDRYVVEAFAGNPLATIRAHSLDYDDFQELRVATLVPRGNSEWYDYIGGVFWAMGKTGRELPGLDMVVTGNIAIGAGLASSAALEMATARAVSAAAGHDWEPLEMARLGRKAENDYVGVSCGIMDQLSVAASKEGCAMLLDCRSLEYSAVPIPPGAGVVVMDTGTRRALANGAYNERRARCEEAARALRRIDPSIRALRDVTPELLERGVEELDEVTYQRAHHVITENRRTLETAEALRRGDLERVGSLMNESHRSLRDSYEVSSPELDRITELAREHSACWGARMTGAGFGGCAVALVRGERAEVFRAEVSETYRSETGLSGSLYVCRPVDGVRIM